MAEDYETFRFGNLIPAFNAKFSQQCHVVLGTEGILTQVGKTPAIMDSIVAAYSHGHAIVTLFTTNHLDARTQFNSNFLQYFIDHHLSLLPVQPTVKYMTFQKFNGTQCVVLNTPGIEVMSLVPYNGFVIEPNTLYIAICHAHLRQVEEARNLVTNLMNRFPGDVHNNKYTKLYSVTDEAHIPAKSNAAYARLIREVRDISNCSMEVSATSHEVEMASRIDHIIRIPQYRDYVGITDFRYVCIPRDYTPTEYALKLVEHEISHFKPEKKMVIITVLTEKTIVDMRRMEEECFRMGAGTLLLQTGRKVVRVPNVGEKDLTQERWTAIDACTWATQNNAQIIVVVGYGIIGQGMTLGADFNIDDYTTVRKITDTLIIGDVSPRQWQAMNSQRAGRMAHRQNGGNSDLPTLHSPAAFKQNLVDFLNYIAYQQKVLDEAPDKTVTAGEQLHTKPLNTKPGTYTKGKNPHPPSMLGWSNFP